MKVFRYVFFFMFFSFLFTIYAFTKATDYKLILLLEIIITGVSALSYYLLTQKEFVRSILTKILYLRWTITTPLMLVVLSLILNIQSVPLILTIIVLDFVMLWFGYAGETNQIHHTAASFGFVPLFIIFYLFYTNSKINAIFFIYVLGWSGYGIAYYFNHYLKYTSIAILDAFTKGLVAILLSKVSLDSNQKLLKT